MIKLLIKIMKVWEYKKLKEKGQNGYVYNIYSQFLLYFFLFFFFVFFLLKFYLFNSLTKVNAPMRIKNK